MLGERASWLRERMDDPACDPLLLRNTYRQFARVNALVTGWRRVFRRHLAPRLQSGTTILDVGCGGGDLARSLQLWSELSGTRVSVTAIDPDQRAIEFALSDPAPSGVDFRQTTAEELASAGERFDVVVSNHLLHHLTDAELLPFLETTVALANGIAIHSDMSRHPVAYGAFAMTRPLFRESFIVEDGLRSIRRAFTPDELRRRVPRDWEVRTLVPFRNLVILEK
ncbi:MAG TPA: methyltransferase domain-containing protein [Trueperaceae bacterium]|nr:methyltransferase domain-containing protein [Trueperaceae bacterium]